MSLFYRGFSLWEVLVSVLLAGLLLGVGVPSFGEFLARNRQSAEVNALFHALYLARKESIRRRQLVALCPSADGKRCQPSRDWSGGWLMFENSDRDEPPENDPAEPVILVHRVDPGVRILANRRGFTSRGTRKRATNGTFVVCDRAARVAPKALVVSYTGRPRVTRKRRSGEAYKCAD